MPCQSHRCTSAKLYVADTLVKTEESLWCPFVLNNQYLLHSFGNKKNENGLDFSFCTPGYFMCLESVPPSSVPLCPRPPQRSPRLLATDAPRDGCSTQWQDFSLSAPSSGHGLRCMPFRIAASTLTRTSWTTRWSHVWWKSCSTARSWFR